MKYFNPSKVLMWWFIGFPVILFLFSLLAGIGHSDGEQVEMTTFARGLILYVTISPFVLLLMPILFFSWLKRHYAVLLILFALFGYLFYLQWLS